MPNETDQSTTRKLAELFHEILAGINSRKMVKDLDAKPVDSESFRIMRKEIAAKIRTDEQIADLCFNGFAIAADALLKNGATDVSISGDIENLLKKVR